MNPMIVQISRTDNPFPRTGISRDEYGVPHFNNLPPTLLDALRSKHRDRLRHVIHRGDGDDDHHRALEVHDEIEFVLIEAERTRVNDLYRRGQLKDEARRRIERELDLREAHLVNVRGES